MPVKVSVGKSRVGLGGLDGVLMACVAIGAGAVASDWDEFLLNPKENKLACPVFVLDITNALRV